jgi:DNA-binding IclR family transcriptional regulator
MKEQSNKYFLLSLFTPDRPNWRLKEIAEIMMLDKTSAYRFANTLIELGYLEKDHRTKVLSLGLKSILLSYRLMRSFDLLQVVKGIIDEAFNLYKVAIDSALLDGNKIVILYRKEVEETLYFRLPMVDEALHCSALGKAVIAFLPDEEMLKIVNRLKFVKKTKNTLTDKKSLLADLRKIRRRGYSLNNEEYVPGLIAIAAPLINVDTRRVVGAVSFDFSTTQHSLSMIERKYAKPILKLGKDISEMIPPVQ